MRSLFICGLLALFAALPLHSAPAAQSSAAPVVARAAELQGEAFVLHPDAKKKQLLRKGDPVFEGDVISTSPKSRLRIVFADKTDLVMAEGGRLVVDKFVYDPARHAGKVRLGVFGAAFSYVSGLIGKSASPDVKIDLDFGSIGIRGTRIYRAMHNNECWIYVEKGRIDVTNRGGKVTLGPGDGTRMSSKSKAPAPPHVWPRREIKWIKDAVTGDPSFPKGW
jgi:hypothetical protein